MSEKKPTGKMQSIRIVKRAVSISALLAALAAGAGGQGFSFGKKKIPVTINHPPTLGINLKGKTVAFNPATGNACRQQFVDSLAEDFGAHGVSLVNRANLNAILKEHQFQFSSSADQASAVEFGKLSGAALMVFVNVTRCEPHRAPPMDAAQIIGQPIHISRMEAHVQASIRTVDLASGRESVKSVQSDQQKDNQSQGLQRPVYPSPEEVIDLAVKDGVAQASRLFFPWTETQQVAFMDSKDCNLKQAYDLLKTGDIDGVLKLSLENVERCKADPKPAHQADALYNLGIAYTLAHDYDNALDALNKSQALHSDKEVLQAIVECRKAKAGDEAVIRKQGENDREDDKRKEDDHLKKVAEEKRIAEDAITNEYIVRSLKEGMGEDLLVVMIQTKPAKFSTSPNDLLALKKAGVPDKVIAAMLTKK